MYETSRSAEIERARASHYQEPENAEDAPPEGPCFVGRVGGEPMFHAWRSVDGEWTSCELRADEMTPDEVAALRADEQSVALFWRERFEALAAERDPESCVHNAQPDVRTVIECTLAEE